MPSLISGYEYDIFISYRHKDNKGGRWVTEFVDALRSELEATFKEDITIYFDESPHDGLLENHTVDESLKEKLKCLIFIPIISQTYCDPKSFAWRNEFLEFKKFAGEDRFGPKVKLPGGNVSSRILPVRIHELEAADRALLENELGPLRAIDFVFKSSGVNRPLSPTEDHPKDNLNKTYYRDQVNKVAHSVKDIISALKNSAGPKSSVDSGVLEVTPSAGRVIDEPSPKKPSSLLSKKWLIPIAIAALVALGFVVYSLSGSSPGFTGAEKSIAILPFENIGSEKENEYISDGITQEIINHLSKIEDIKGVTGWTSARLYKKATKSIKEIGQELGVASIVTGTIQKEGDQLRVIAELTDVNTGLRIWGSSYNRIWGDVLALQSELSQAIAANLNTQLTTDEVRRVELKVTNNPLAYEDYLRGKNNFYAGFTDRATHIKNLRAAERHFLEAVKKDSSFALAWSILGSTYMNQALTFDSVDRFQYYDKALGAAIIGITYGPDLSETNMHLSDVFKSVTLNPFSASRYLLRSIELNPNDADAYYLLAWLYMEMGQMDKVEATIIKSVQLSPLSINSSTLLWFYFFSREKEKLRTFTHEQNTPATQMTYNFGHLLNNFLEERFDSVLVMAEQMNLPQFKGIAYAKLGQSEKAKKLIDAIEEQSKANWYGTTGFGTFSNPQADISVIYAWMGDKEKALDHLEQAYRLRERSLLGLRYNILFDPIRSEKRFKALLDRMGPNN